MELIIPTCPEPPAPVLNRSSWRPHPANDESTPLALLVPAAPDFDVLACCACGAPEKLAAARRALADAAAEIARLRALLAASEKENAAWRARGAPLRSVSSSSSSSDDEHRRTGKRRRRGGRARVPPAPLDAPKPWTAESDAILVPPAPSARCTVAGDDDDDDAMTDDVPAGSGGGGGFESAAPALDCEVPEELLCPITFEIFVDPVVAADGHTYSRAAIERWLDTGRHTSPLTGLPLASRTLARDDHAAARAAAFVALHAVRAPAAEGAAADATAAAAGAADGGATRVPTSARAPLTTGDDEADELIDALLDGISDDALLSDDDATPPIGAARGGGGGARGGGGEADDDGGGGGDGLHPATQPVLDELLTRNLLAPLKVHGGGGASRAQLHALVSTCLSLGVARPSRLNGGVGRSKLQILQAAVDAFHAAGPARTAAPARGNMAEKVLSRIFDEIKHTPRHAAVAVV